MTFNLPIAFPFVVNGRLVGICILGMTSSGKLSEAPCCVAVSSSSSSPLEMMAWLALSSNADSSSDSFNETMETDLGVLDIAEVGTVTGASNADGIGGVGTTWPDSFLFDFREGGSFKLSAGGNDSAEELCDPDLAIPFFWFPTSCEAASVVFVVASTPKAASSVSARFCTPYVLARFLLALVGI